MNKPLVSIIISTRDWGSKQPIDSKKLLGIIEKVKTVTFIANLTFYQIW